MKELIVALLLTALLLAPAIGGGSLYSTIADCEWVSGEIIDMEDDTASNVLYVELTMPRENIRGFRVYVSDDTYNNYSIGESYSEEVCDLQALTDIQDTINSMLEWGFIVEY